MRANEQQIKDFNFIINQFNAEGKWIITVNMIKKEMKKLSSFEGFDSIPTFITNSMTYLIRNNLAAKGRNRGEYFLFVKHSFPIIEDPLKIIKEASEIIKLDKKIIDLIESLNILEESDNDNIFSKESLFSSIIEYSSLTESNIKDREKFPNDPEIIEKKNLSEVYRIMEQGVEPLSDFLLKQIHSRIFAGLGNTRRMIGKIGEYTQHQNFISGGYVPCSMQNKLSQLKAFIEFFNDKPKDTNDAILRVSLISYWFAGIHIFEDGNSRTGRVLISYYMKLHSITDNPNFTISKALQSMGGKTTFVEMQGDAWDSYDPIIYMEWFTKELLTLSWPRSLSKAINR